MARQTFRNLASVPAVGLLSVIATASAGCFLSWDPPPKPVSNWTIEDARQFDAFPVYWLGEAYQGLPLTSMRILTPAYTHEYVTVSIFYGEPSYAGDRFSGSWNPPLEISIYHRCDNPPEEVIPRLDSEFLEEEEISGTQVLGVDGYVVRYADDFDYLKIWSGRSAIFLDTWKTKFDIEQAARNLIPIIDDAGATLNPLPPPTTASC
jgi:hypothetical protein